MGADTDLRPAPVAGDPALLERLVANLLENAVRYNDERQWIRVTTGQHEGRAQLTVANTGEPIDPGETEALFEAFRRRSDSSTQDSGGSGLGLAIVQALAKAHGGTVTASARADGGLEVRVELPISEPGPEPLGTT